MSNEHDSWSKWTSKKYVIGSLGTDTAYIPWDFLYRVTDNNVLDKIR